MTDEAPKDIPTLMFVANDLFRRAKELHGIIDSGVLGREDPTPGGRTTTEARADVMHALGRIYSNMAHAQYEENKACAENTKTPEPYQPPPVESKKSRELVKKLSAVGKPIRQPTSHEARRAKARPRDFLAQAVSFALGQATRTASEVVAWLVQHYQDAGIHYLLPQLPTKARVAETLSDHSRDPKNPRYLRVRQGWYKNNPKYKKAR